jgi:serine-type D-Ala-D-Ala carboxypeptidase/endopeptidase (penicillin-binding protein 4)
MAESIQYFMGSIIKGDSGKGVELMREYARKHLGEDVDIINGSGLGNDKNKLPGSFYMKILKKFYSDRYGMIDFFYSMPVIGEDGTLKKAAVDNGCSGCIRGKTGSLTGVTALSGIMKAKSGKTYLYVFAVNDFPAKSFKITWAFRDIVMNQVWEKY